MTIPSIADIETSFKQYLESIYHPIIGDFKFDTPNWQRYDCPTSAKGNQNVSYKAHTDGRPCLKVQCHKCYPETLCYKYNKQPQFTYSQSQAMREEAEKRKTKQAKIHAAALMAMRTEWNNARPCISHRYFNRKELSIIESDGLKLDRRGRVLCPIKLITGELVSTQSIPFQGKKKFYSGVSPKNGFHVFGSIEASDDIFFGEGVATCLTIKMLTGKPIICVYGKRFAEIAPIIAKAYPDKAFIFCCDLPSKGEPVTSEDNAKKAVNLVGGRICSPNFSMIPEDLKPEIKRSDFNDLFMLLLTQRTNRTTALDIVRQQIQQHPTEGNCMPKNKTEQCHNNQPKEPKAAEALLQLIDSNGFAFFHDDHQDAFCKYPSQKSKVYEVRRINDRKFKNYLSYIYRQAIGKTISEPALNEAISEMEGRALHDKNSKQEKVFLRIGATDAKIYIDLCNDKWQAIEISSNGWRILESKDLPIRFERSQHSQPLPDPSSVNPGDISKLWELVNIPEEDHILVLAFILECYRCTTAFPILCFLGLQDSGKSATQDTIRGLIDPSSSNLRTAPRKVDDLVTEAASNWLVSYNNVSSLSDEMHDDFCCIATGSGFATRKFYTNTQQLVINIARPVVINGIFNFIRRPDLLDRAIILELDSIDESKRKTDAQLNKAMRENLPSIFRGMLDLLVNVLRVLPSVTLDKQPRMADFALLGAAVEKALKLPNGTFINRYRANRTNAKESVLDSSPIMLALCEFIEKQENQFWRGRPSELLDVLTAFKNPSTHTTWLKTPHAMGGELRRYTAPLHGVGIQIIDEAKLSGKKNRTGNVYRISKINTDKNDDEKTCPQSPPSPQNDSELSDGATSLGIGGVDIGGGISAKSTQSPHLKKPASPHETYTLNGSVDFADIVDIKTKHKSVITQDNDSVLI